jgi:hypothetical protein
VADFRFTDTFLQKILQIERGFSQREQEILDDALARITQDPLLPGSGLSHYDPSRPRARIYRASPFMIHYHVADDGAVEFLDVFPP